MGVMGVGSETKGREAGSTSAFNAREGQTWDLHHAVDGS